MEIQLINEEILRIQSIMSLPKNKILNEGVPDLLIKKILGKQVLKSLLTMTERDLVEKFLRETLSSISDIEKKELRGLLKTNKGEALIKELEAEAKASTSFVEQGTLNQKITDLRNLEGKLLDNLGEYGKDIAKGFKEGWKTPGVLPQVLKNIVIKRTWPLKNLSAEEKKRFYMWFFTGSKTLPKELKGTFSKLGFGPAVSQVGGEFVRRYLYLVGFFSLCKLIYILIKNNMSPEYEYDKESWEKYADVIGQSITLPDIKWTSPCWLVTPAMLTIIKELFAGGSLKSISEGLKRHMKESSKSIKDLINKTKSKVKQEVEPIADKISDSKPGFIFWTKLPKVKKEYDDYFEGVGYTKNPDETWVWDETKNTFVPY